MRYIIYILFFVTTMPLYSQENAMSLKESYKQSILNDDIAKQKTYASQLKSQYTQNELNYYRTQIKRLPNKSLLITSALEDTYPLIILQNTEQLGTGVQIVSLKLLVDDEKYLKRLLKKYNLSTEFDKTSKSIYLRRFLKAKNKIFLSNTINPDLYNNVASKTYLIGLSSEYHCSNQYDKLELFWNGLKAKNNYRFNLTEKEKGIYSNYLPPLLTLYKLKIYKGIKDEKLKTGIYFIGKLLNKTELVNTIIKQYEKGG